MMNQSIITSFTTSWGT